MDGKDRPAHVCAWFLSHGEWPKFDILHSCDFPPCNNPSHLFQGTQADNAADMVSKGRSAKGERQGRAKLTDKKVRNIRRLHAKGWPQNIIAEHYNVSTSAIHYIITGKTWTHVI